MAQKVNLVIDQGTTFTTTLTVNDDAGNPINLSTYTTAGQIRKHYTSSNSVSFTATANSSGVITLSLTANATSNLTAGRYVYDIELTTAGGVVSRIVEGIVTITPQVTR